MMWWGWLIIIGIIVAALFCLGMYARWRWEESVKKFNAGLLGYILGLTTALILILILERVW
jgi:uncharacterized membrane protein